MLRHAWRAGDSHSPADLEAFTGELAYGLQQDLFVAPHRGRRESDQAPVDQVGDLVEADLQPLLVTARQRLEVATTAEDAELPKRFCCSGVRRSKLQAMVCRRVRCRVGRLQFSAAQLQAVIKPGENGVRCQQFRPGRGQLCCQRHPIEPVADGNHVGDIVSR